MQLLADEAKEKNKKLCVNYIRGCKKMLDPDHEYSKCSKCRKKARKTDKQRRDRRKDHNVKALQRGSKNLICQKCGKKKKKKFFINGHSELGNKCTECLKRDDMVTKKKRKIYRKNDKLYDYKRKASIRGLVWELSNKKALELFDSKCKYCGIKPLGTSGNGIDRFDNDQGYIEGNVVPCCSVCNRAKNSYEYGDFIDYCIHIYENYPCAESNETNFANGHVSFTRYAQKKYHCKAKREINFDLEKNEYEKFMTKKCYYCGSFNMPGHIGIDRLSSKIGYDKKNIVPCCSICNTMKRDMSVSQFYNHVLKILETYGHIDKTECLELTIPSKNDKVDIEELKRDLLQFVPHNPIKNTDKKHNDTNKSFENLRNDCSKTYKSRFVVCTEKKDIDIWNYFSGNTTSEIKILIKNKIENMVIGLIGLSDVVQTNSPLNKKIGWNYKNKIYSKKLKYIANLDVIKFIGTGMTSKKGIRKLSKMLFASTLHDKIDEICGKRYVGIMALSMKKSSRFDWIKELEFLRFTREKQTRHISKRILANCREYYIQNELGSKYSSNWKIISGVCEHLGISDICSNKTEYAVYFGELADNAINILRNKERIEDLNFKF